MTATRSCDESSPHRRADSRAVAHRNLTVEEYRDIHRWSPRSLNGALPLAPSRSPSQQDVLPHWPSRPASVPTGHSAGRGPKPRTSTTSARSAARLLVVDLTRLLVHVHYAGVRRLRVVQTRPKAPLLQYFRGPRPRVSDDYRSRMIVRIFRAPNGVPKLFTEMDVAGPEFVPRDGTSNRLTPARVIILAATPGDQGVKNAC
jgi:hypothetical protein